jgi:hypothetical protein
MKRTSPHFPQTTFPLGAIQYRAILQSGQEGNSGFTGVTFAPGSGHTSSTVGRKVASTIADFGRGVSPPTVLGSARRAPLEHR